MSRMRLWLAVAFAVAWAAPCAAAPLSAYGNLPTIEQMAISPSGRLLAIDVTQGEQRTIVIQDLVARKLVTGIKVGQTKVRQIQWAGDDHLLVTASSTSGIVGVLAARSEWYVVTDLNIPANRFTPLLADLPDMTGLNVVEDFPVIRTVNDKTEVFVTGVHFEQGAGRASLFRIALDTDRSTLVEVGDERTIGFMMGPDDHPLVQEQYDPAAGFWGLRIREGGFWRDAQQRKVGIESPDVVGLGRDGKTILIATRNDEGDTLQELSPDGVTLSDPLPVGHWDSLLHDPISHRLIGTVALVGDDVRYTYFDPKDQAAWDAIVAAFPGSQVTLVSQSRDRQKLIVRVDSPTEGPGFVLVDLKGHSTVALGNEYAGLGEDDIGPVMPVRY